MFIQALVLNVHRQPYVRLRYIRPSFATFFEQQFFFSNFDIHRAPKGIKFQTHLNTTTTQESFETHGN